MKVFYHNDNDGKLAAAIVYRSYIKEITNPDDTFIEVNYGSSIPTADRVDENELVYIVDYSFTQETCVNLQGILDKGCKVVWLDHHKSSQDLIESDRFKNIKGDLDYMININSAGCAIAYKYLFEKLGTYAINVLPHLRLVDDYDRWVFTYGDDSLFYNIGSTMYDTSPTSDFWFTVNDFDRILELGKALKEYKDSLNRKYCKQNAYEITINGYKCIVMNTPESSSQAFVDLYDKYKLAIRYVFDGEKFNYSIYSSLPDIDCSKVAKTLDKTGGGHKGAAGFRLDDVLSKDTNIFVEFLI